MPLVAFVIPVRHPLNAPDWSAVVGRLMQTIGSLSAQSSPDWQGFVVVNREADLPALAVGWQRVDVDLPPNPNFDIARHGRERAWEAVRLDKGMRVLAGVVAAADAEYVMVCDDDDFVSRELVGYVRSARGAAGWEIRKGYLWGEGSRLLLAANDFSAQCGTSHIVRRDLLRLPSKNEPVDVDYVKRMFGSHRFIARALHEAGHPLTPLPFRGAIYRMGHAGAHSGSRHPLRSRVLSLQAMKRPVQWLRTLATIRVMGKSTAAEFGVVEPS